MAQNDVWRFSCVGSHAGTELAVITLHGREISGIAETATFCAGIVSNLLTPFAARQGMGFRWDIINALTVNTTPRKSAEYTTSLPITGSLTANTELPHQVALVTTEKTAFAGRSYRGRTYLPGLTETDSDSGLWTSTCTNAMLTAWNNFLAVFGSAGSSTDWRWVVWSTKLGSANNITSVVVRNNPGIIRRRRVGVGQ